MPELCYIATADGGAPALSVVSPGFHRPLLRLCPVAVVASGDFI